MGTEIYDDLAYKQQGNDSMPLDFCARSRVMARAVSRQARSLSLRLSKDIMSLSMV